MGKARPPCCASQGAAGEGRARLHVRQAPQEANFAAAREKTIGAAPSVGALPLRQTAAPQAAQQPVQAQPSARLGQHIDITV